MSDKNSPAFPAIDGSTAFYERGISKLEFFACNAPNEIPSWFVHISPEKGDAKAPRFDEVENEKDRELCREWLHDPIFDLPEHLQWFADKTNEATEQHCEWLWKDKAARYFQWRRYYAEQLLAELSTPQP